LALQRDGHDVGPQRLCGFSSYRAQAFGHDTGFSGKPENLRIESFLSFEANSVGTGCAGSRRQGKIQPFNYRWPAPRL
jgi:hypothetical protein